MKHLERVAPGNYKVMGVVNIDNAADVEQEGRGLLQEEISEGRTVQIGFAELTNGDSATLAMILSWMRLARAGNSRFCISDLPEELVALSRVCGIEPILQGSACQI